MKKIIFTAVFWLVGCVSLPQLGDGLSVKPLDALSPEQSRLIIYLDVPLSRYQRVNVDSASSLYILPNSFQEVVLEAGVHNLSIPGFFYGQSVMPLLGFDAVAEGSWDTSSTATKFETLSATTHYLRFEIHNKPGVRECAEDTDTIMVCSFTYNSPLLKEVVESEALEQIAEYREVLNEEI